MLADDFRAVFLVASAIGILPFYNRQSMQFYTKSYWIIALITCNLAAIIVSIIRTSIMNAEMGILHIYVQPLLNVFFNLQTIISLNFYKREELQSLFDTFNFIDKDFEMIHKVKENRIKYVWVFLIAINVIYVGMNVFNIVVWLPQIPPLDIFAYYLGDAFSCYNINTLEFFKVLILYSIKKRFDMFNELLLGIDHGEVFVGQAKVENYIRLHRKCCDLAEYVNSTFGWNILLSIVQTLLYILKLAVILLDDRADDTTNNLMSNLIWCIYSVIQGIVVATMCEKVVDEGKKTITVAYKALYRYSNVPAMREKLFILAQQASARCPQFSAAGFFNVDFSMLFTFVNLITTYVIVIIQFSMPSGNNSNSNAPSNDTSVSTVVNLSVNKSN